MPSQGAELAIGSSGELGDMERSDALSPGQLWWLGEQPHSVTKVCACDTVSQKWVISRDAN